MLPLWSAKLFVCGGFKSFSPHGMRFYANCTSVDLHIASSKRRPSSCLHFNNVGNTKLFVSTGINTLSLYQNGSPNLRQCALNSYQFGVMDEPPLNDMMVAENDRLLDFLSKGTDNMPIETASHPVSHSFNMDAHSLSFLETKFSDIVSKLRESAADASNIGKNFLNNFSDSVTLSLTTSLKDTNQAVDNSINEVISFINKSVASPGSKLKEALARAGPFALDVLRGAVVVVENSLVQGGKNVGYAYSFLKEYLPRDVQEPLDLAVEIVGKVLFPAGTAFQQVYMAVKAFEESLGLDPNDPLVPASYRIVKYSGYAGDLPPCSALKLLQGNENAVLVDVRPENFKERDGVPDLRRAARFRYASVTLPEVDGSVKKLLKGGRDIEYTLLAAVIRNLNIVDDKSKVLVMDADGTYSKGVARSLRKLGTKKPYMVQGGFRSWVKNGLRIKIAKPETTLTIINEEAEAILEEIKPTPLKTIGYGVVFVAAIYSAVEWEKTLQFIGVLVWARVYSAELRHTRM